MFLLQEGNWKVIFRGKIQVREPINQTVHFGVAVITNAIRFNFNVKAMSVGENSRTLRMEKLLYILHFISTECMQIEWYNIFPYFSETLPLSLLSLSLLFFPSFSNLVYHSRSPSIIIILLFVSFIVSYIDVGSFIVPTHFSKWYKSSIFRLEKCHLRRGPKRPGRWMKPPIQSKPKRIIKFNNNLMITGMIPMYASWSLRRLLMPLLFAST
jgi:hypothetical protein